MIVYTIISQQSRYKVDNGMTHKQQQYVGSLQKNVVRPDTLLEGWYMCKK